MKVSISRKGFDSSKGGGNFISPILPDGTLLSIPIPTNLSSNIKYSNIVYKGRTYLDILQQLGKDYSSRFVHLDPDMRFETLPQRDSLWRPTLGQSNESSSLSHLNNQKFGIGDLFLFMGLFRQTEFYNGKLRFIPNSPKLHIIWGYLQVGNVYTEKGILPEWLHYHAHYDRDWSNDIKSKMNAIYEASDILSIFPEENIKGSGVFKYNERLVLTKKGHSASHWDLPSCFFQTDITNTRGWKNNYNYLDSGGLGQERVFETNAESLDWIRSLFKNQDL